ncbi:MAG: FadR/GntR family transcriptional regulator [Roseburia sp.]
MQFGEIVAPSIKELFMNRIETLILSGELKPGEKLPTERELADEMKISKTAIHEGIRELSRLGFLDVTSRKGITVADYANNGNVDTLLTIMKYQGNNLDYKTAISLMDIRIYLECPAIEALAQNRKENDIKNLKASQEFVLQKMTASNEEFAEAVYLYHRRVVFLSGNSITPLLMNSFFSAMLPFWIDYIESFGRENTFQKLVLYTELIRDKKGKEASDTLKAGIEQYRKRVMLQAACSPKKI